MTGTHICQPQLSLLVESIESNLPLSLLAGGLPQLSHRAVGVSEECEALLLLAAVGCRHSTREQHLVVGVCSGEMQVVSRVVYPELMPTASCPIIEVEALAGTALRSCPVLVYDALTLLESDVVGPRLFSLNRHVPLTNPEVELPELGRVARRRGLLSGEGCGDGSDNAEHHRQRRT